MSLFKSLGCHPIWSLIIFKIFCSMCWLGFQIPQSEHFALQPQSDGSLELWPQPVPFIMSLEEMPESSTSPTPPLPPFSFLPVDILLISTTFQGWGWGGGLGRGGATSSTMRGCLVWCGATEGYANDSWVELSLRCSLLRLWLKQMFVFHWSFYQKLFHPPEISQIPFQLIGLMDNIQTAVSEQSFKHHR